MDNSEFGTGVQIPLHGVRDGVKVVLAHALISPESLSLVEKHRWNIKSGYAYTVIQGTPLYMHRMLMDYPVGKAIDHINQNKLDNRLSNLRITNQGANVQNTARVGKHGYRGVCFHKLSGLYAARISFERKVMSLGYYKTAAQAAAAYNDAALRFYGEHAALNVIQEAAM